MISPAAARFSRTRGCALARRISPAAEPRLAIAESPGIALARARLERHAGPSSLDERLRLPLEVLHDYVSPFAHDPDARRPVDRMITLMRALGLKTLGDFLALPPSGLASRFGREAVALSARARGELPVAWPGFHPAERVLERAGQGGENVEALVFVLRGLVDRAMARLRGRCERAAVVQVTLELEKWSTVGAASEDGARAWKRFLRVEFPLPQGGSGGILPILQEQLSHVLERKPLTAPVEAVGFEILEAVPGRGAQKDFFSRKEEQDEALESLFARLSQKVGNGNAFVACPVDRHLPEGAYLRSLQFGELPPQSVLPRRPARLLKRPEKLLLQGGAITRPGGRRYLARLWRGPERLVGEWWKEGFDRDYFEVLTETGELLWVFKNGAESGDGLFYLHGFFD